MAWKETGYICGNALPIEGFEIHRKICCGDPIESQYYCTSSAGGRLVTTDVCCLCSDEEGLMKTEEIRKLPHVSVKNPLPVCPSCAKLKIKIPGSLTDFVKRRKELEKKRTNATAAAVSLGRKQKHTE